MWQCRAGRSRERGMMLVLMTVLSALLLAVVAALFVPALSRHKGAAETEWGAKCLYAADAGVHRAKYDLYNGRSNGFSDELQGPYGTGVTTAYEPGLAYAVRVVNDSADPGGPSNDTNDLVIVRSTGTGGGVSRTIEVPIQIVSLQSWTTNKALLVNGDFTISGNADITGLMSNVHANGTLAVSGSPTIDLIAASARALTVTGSPMINGDHLNTEAKRDAYGAAHSNAAAESVPDVDVTVFRPAADYILVSSGPFAGFVYDAAAGTYTDANGTAVNGWKWNDAQAAGRWMFSGSAWTPGTWYVEGSAKIAGSPGSNASPVQGSVITEGDLEITGSPHFVKDHTSIMLASGGDLKIAGNPDLQEDQATAEGAFLVRGQLSISGAPGIRGSMVVQDVAGTGTLVSANDISGNATIAYDGLLAPVPELTVTRANVVAQIWSVQ